MGTSPSGELNTTGVAEYSDFGPISERVKDRSKVCINHFLVYRNAIITIITFSGPRSGNSYT